MRRTMLKEKENQTAFVLASTSPRRKELLSYLGLKHTYHYAIDTDETISQGWSPQEAVMRLGLNKGLAVLSALASMPDKLSDEVQSLSIIAADTIVVRDEHILGKPKSKADAYDMLSSLQGRTHEVYTGLSLLSYSIKKLSSSGDSYLSFAEQLKEAMQQKIGQQESYNDFGAIGQYLTYSGALNSASYAQLGYTKSKVTFRPLTEQDIWTYIETGDPLDKAGAYGIQNIGAVNIESIQGDFYSVMGLPLSLLHSFIKESSTHLSN